MEGYNLIVNAIIRPPRQFYSSSQLGPEEFAYGGVQFVRRDMILVNHRNLGLTATFWHRRDAPVNKMPCVVYCHGNASSRVEALDILQVVLAAGERPPSERLHAGRLRARMLSAGASCFAFDFAGCGHSEGEYISLGWYEHEDLAFVIRQGNACI